MTKKDIEWLKRHVKNTQCWKPKGSCAGCPVFEVILKAENQLSGFKRHKDSCWDETEFILDLMKKQKLKEIKKL